MTSHIWDKTLRRQLTRRRVLVGAGTTTVAAALLGACGGSKSSGSGADKTSLVSRAVDTSKLAKRGGVNKWFIGTDVPSFDLATTTAPLQSMQSQVMGRLLEDLDQSASSPDLQVGPELAESWEWSPDLLQLTLKLRQGVKWHNKPPVNGRAFDVDDVLFSWNRFAAKGTNRSTIVNSVNPYAPVVSFSAPDSKTIVIKLKEPVAYLTSLLSYSTSGGLVMVPKETDTTFDSRGDMIGTSGYVLANYTPSVGFSYKRNPEYSEKDRDVPYADQIDVPIITEYAQGLAQLKAGNLYTYTVRGEDVLATKRDVPDLKLYKIDPALTLNVGKTTFGWLPAGKSPFLDERVRQAYSMSIDRDLWIDTFFNVSKFESEGLPVETWWNTNFNHIKGAWLDPKDKSFGPNAKYLQHNPGEAKKLLGAAGYASGLDIPYTVIAGTQLGSPAGGAGLLQVVEVERGMVGESGFRIANHLVDYASDYLPHYRDANGNYEGLAYTVGAPAAQEPVAVIAWNFHSKSGVNFFGFDANGKSDNSGDPQVDTMIEKARMELDTEKRRAMVFDLQRYLIGKMYAVHVIGGATGFGVAWPALSNYGVFKSVRKREPWRWWIDETQPPLKKG
jgi:ABC-type transport system substrate-binding protein